MAIDADAALQNAEEDTYEDAEFSEKGRKEFCDFVELWNEKYSEKYYIENNKIAVIVPDDLVKSILVVEFERMI